jgi:general secretion pathway protein M
MSAAAEDFNRWRAIGSARWKAMAPRERTAVTVAGLALVVLLVWLLAIAPAWRTTREAPAALDRLDAQLLAMQRLASEARELKAGPPVGAAQAAAALKSATDRLGERARIVVLGDRATLTLTGVSGDALRQWLAEARSGARARPVEAQLTRAPQGFTGTVVVTLPGAS